MLMASSIIWINDAVGNGKMAIVGLRSQQRLKRKYKLKATNHHCVGIDDFELSTSDIDMNTIRLATVRNSNDTVVVNFDATGGGTNYYRHRLMH